MYWALAMAGAGTGAGSVIVVLQPTLSIVVAVDRKGHPGTDRDAMIIVTGTRTSHTHHHHTTLCGGRDRTHTVGDSHHTEGVRVTAPPLGHVPIFAPRKSWERWGGGVWLRLV